MPQATSKGQTCDGFGNRRRRRPGWPWEGGCSLKLPRWAGEARVRPLVEGRLALAAPVRTGGMVGRGARAARVAAAMMRENKQGMNEGAAASLAPSLGEKNSRGRRVLFFFLSSRAPRRPCLMLRRAAASLAGRAGRLASAAEAQVRVCVQGGLAARQSTLLLCCGCSSAAPSRAQNRHPESTLTRTRHAPFHPHNSRAHTHRPPGVCPRPRPRGRLRRTTSRYEPWCPGRGAPPHASCRTRGSTRLRLTSPFPHNKHDRTWTRRPRRASRAGTRPPCSPPRRKRAPWTRWTRTWSR